MLVPDGEKKLHVEQVPHIVEDAAATSVRLHMQRHTEQTTLQNKGVHGIVGLVIKSNLSSHYGIADKSAVKTESFDGIFRGH